VEVVFEMVFWAGEMDMITEWKPKPIAEIPAYLHCKLWGGLTDDELEVCFWAGDDEANLFLYLDPPQVKELEDYGVSDELIEWMRENDMYETDTGFANDKPYDMEVFKITDRVVSQWYAT